MVHLSARHYNSALSIWLSVDPMSDKYPGVSPYAYCGNNPVRLVDPNGEELTDFYDISTGEHLLHIEDGIDEAIAVQRNVFDAYNQDGTLYANKDKIGCSLGANSDFVALAGTIYAESDARYYSIKEAAGIGSVIRNRATADNTSLLKESSKGGIYGWSNRNAILTSPNTEKVNIAYKAAMLTIGGDCDYSNGGYFWQGRDFPVSGSPANKQFYQSGFLFNSTSHDLFSMGSKSVNTSWEYKYESTAAAGKTVFMRLTQGWKDAHRTTKWHGGR